MAKDINIKEPVKNGDWNITDSDQQHIEHICMAKPGDFKNAPLIGVNLRSYIHGTLYPKIVGELEKAIRLNLEADGVKNIKVTIDASTSKIETNGNY